MAIIAKYLVLLAIDVEVPEGQEVLQEENFGTHVEDGTVSIYANHGEDWIVGCVQEQTTLVRCRREER